MLASWTGLLGNVINVIPVVVDSSRLGAYVFFFFFSSWENMPKGVILVKKKKAKPMPAFLLKKKSEFSVILKAWIELGPCFIFFLKRRKTCASSSKSPKNPIKQQAGTLGFSQRVYSLDFWFDCDGRARRQNNQTRAIVGLMVYEPQIDWGRTLRFDQIVQLMLLPRSPTHGLDS